LTILSDWLHDATHYFFPHQCTGCGSDTIAKDALLCSYCIANLPNTNFAANIENPIEKIFWGRTPVQAAHAEYYFSKSSLIQHLIHQLKYKGNKDIGHFLGEMLGNSLLNSHRFTNIDYLIPLPLFAKREKKRGYNQAAIICNGMSTIMNIPVATDVLARKYFTETQTKKQRTERWQNVSESFMIKNQQKIYQKNILLVDDVITTGATLEAGANTLLQCNANISIAALAFANR
jgi:ComF family protein